MQDKYKLTSKLGIQTRDLRLLDPHFTTTYPSCILCRDKSIVVNLEHIKVCRKCRRMLWIAYTLMPRKVGRGVCCWPPLYVEQFLF